MTWFVYILHCSNGSFYVGHTGSVEKRFVRHRSGAGARHTAQQPPDQVVLTEAFPTEIEANRREPPLKGWSRAKKQALIAGDLQTLRPPPPRPL
ncbi:MAG: GIY-YIG nuclease family protein [Kiritimatiellae bacterium]|nr:GIY-YIG nuclease family protein [Kiritimatiellia bacterium]